MDPVWSTASEQLRYEFEHKALPGFLFGPSAKKVVAHIASEGLDDFLAFCWATLSEHFDEDTGGFPMWQVRSPRPGFWLVDLPSPVMEVDVLTIGLWIPHLADREGPPQIHTLECFEMSKPQLGLHCEWTQEEHRNYGPESGMARSVFEGAVAQRVGFES